MPTREQYERAISRAQKAGDQEAMYSLIKDARIASAPEGTFLEKLGAGMQDVVLGGKQLLGLAKPGEVAEHEEIAKSADPSGWTRMAGNAIATAPLALIPGAATVRGAMAAGAASGLLMPTTNEDVFEGKLANAAIGGATGGAFQKGAQMLPKAFAGAKRQIAERTPLLPGTKQEIAEEAFTKGIADLPAAESKLASYAPPRELPGFKQSSAAVIGEPTQLAAERQLREAGGELGQPLRDLTETQHKAVADAWRSEFGGGKLAAADAARDAFAKATTPGLVLKRSLGKPGDFDPVQNIITSAKAKAIGPEAAAVDKLEDMFHDALVKAANSGDIEALHKFRRFGINDILTGMYREGAPQSAVSARGTIQQVKTALDGELDRLLKGKNRFSNFMQGYRDRSLKMSQAGAGEEMLAKLEARAPTAAGTPQYGALEGDIRKQFAGGSPIDPKYKSPVYNPQQERLLQATAREGEQARAPYSQTIGPRGSATAQNLRPFNSVLDKAMGAQQAANKFTTGESIFSGGGVIGAVTGNPVALAATGMALAKRYGLDPARASALNDIATRMVGMYTDPQQALDAILRARLPKPQQAYLTQVAQQLIAASAGGAAAGGP